MVGKEIKILYNQRKIRLNSHLELELVYLKVWLTNYILQQNTFLLLIFDVLYPYFMSFFGHNL